MKLSLKYNFAITIAAVFIGVLEATMVGEPPSDLVYWIFGREIRDPVSGLTLTLTILPVLFYASMLLLRSLWNKLIVHIINAREIDLSQAYALIIFFGVFTVGF